MTSYKLVENIRFPPEQRKFQNEVHPMAAQVVTVDKSYGYDALTHKNKHSNDSGYFTIDSGYGNNKLQIGYDAGCARGIVKRDILGRVTIVDPAVGPQSQDCGCTKYKKRNCTGTMVGEGGNIRCGASIFGKGCPKNNPVCCNSGDMCSPRMMGDTGICIAGQPYPYYGGKVG
jgi:hypothetical protein